MPVSRCSRLVVDSDFGDDYCVTRNGGGGSSVVLSPPWVIVHGLYHSLCGEKDKKHFRSLPNATNQRR